MVSVHSRFTPGPNPFPMPNLPLQTITASWRRFLKAGLQGRTWDREGIRWVIELIHGVGPLPISPGPNPFPMPNLPLQTITASWRRFLKDGLQGRTWDREGIRWVIELIHGVGPLPITLVRIPSQYSANLPLQTMTASWRRFLKVGLQGRTWDLEGIRWVIELIHGVGPLPISPGPNPFPMPNLPLQTITASWRRFLKDGLQGRTWDREGIRWVIELIHGVGPLPISLQR